MSGRLRHSFSKLLVENKLQVPASALRMHPCIFVYVIGSNRSAGRGGVWWGGAGVAERGGMHVMVPYGYDDAFSGNVWTTSAYLILHQCAMQPGPAARPPRHASSCTNNE